MSRFMLLLALCAGFLMTGAPPAKADPLKDYLWEQRVFVVFAPDADNLEARKQIKWLELQKDGFAARDMILILAHNSPDAVLTNDLQGHISTAFPHSAATLFERYRADRRKFSAMLVGKDGGVKARYEHPTRAEDIFGLIDTMPMRARELEKEKQDAKEKAQSRKKY